MITLLPPSWDPPGSLPPGVTVAPADDPAAAARRLAERVGAELLTTMDEAERALARSAAHERARRLKEEAAEATRLAAALEGADPAADRRLLAEAPELARQEEAGRAAGELAEEARAVAAALEAARAAEAPLAAASLRAAEAAAALGTCSLASVEEADARAAADTAATAAALATDAQEALGPRPDPDEARTLAVEARRRVAEAQDALDVAELQAATLRSRLTGAVLAAVGVALVLAGARAAPPAVAAVVPLAAVVAGAVAWRRRQQAVGRAQDALAVAATEADRAADRHSGVALELADWRRRAERQRGADAAMTEAMVRWEAMAGAGADPERVDELLARRNAVRAAARDLEAAAAAHAEARARVARAEAAWERLATSAGFPAGTTPAEVLAELERRQAVGAEARSRLAGLVRAEARCEARDRLLELLHGRRLDRLQQEAASAPAPPEGAARPLVLAEPFAGVGGGRRRAFLRELERAVVRAPVAVVTADVEALAWAAGRADPGTEGPTPLPRQEDAR